MLGVPYNPPQEPPLIIRTERETDLPAIALITQAAFATEPHSRHTEQFIIAALRAAGALRVSLVAEVDGQVVGHVAFSPVTLSDGSADWYGVGPLAVSPEVQNRGIGTALMHAGLAAVRKLGGQGCVLVGDPAFYARFGFRATPALTLDGVPPENLLALTRAGEDARGRVTFHPAFAAEA